LLIHDLGLTWSEVDYLAGSWSYDLVNGLLWACSKGSRLRFYNAPSWSWASVDREVHYRYHDDANFCDAVVEVIEASTTLASPTSIYGAVTDGYIRLKGASFQAPFTYYTQYSFYTLKLLSDSEVEMCEGIMQGNIIIQIEWDNHEFGMMLETAKAYFMPFGIFTTDDSTGLCMEGLVLQPSGSSEGQFRRIGLFRVEDPPTEYGEDESTSDSHSSHQDDPVQVESDMIKS
jgi:hypothetical protein